MSTSRQTCCIKGCSNTKKNNPRLTFYAFPKGTTYKPHKAVKRKLWIRTIQQHMQLKNWQPPSDGRICSAHFRHNYKVDSPPNHSSYVPSIFPNIQSENCHKSCIETYQQHNQSYNYHFDNGGNSSVNIHEVYMKSELFSEGPSIGMELINLKCDAECQTDVVETSQGVDPEVNMYCTMEKYGNICNTEIQVNIITRKLAGKVSSAEIYDRNFDNVGVNTDPYNESECFGFDSFAIPSINDDESLIKWTGVSFITFNYLLKLIPDFEDMELSKPNQLLLTLIKLRLGKEFSNLDDMFQINENSAYKIFLLILNHLYNILDYFISWPPKVIVKASAPDLFKKYHPNARIIKDYKTIIIRRSYNMDNQETIPVQYQNVATAKFLFGSTPSGIICFVSQCYPGTTEDSFLTYNSGLVNLLDQDDVVLCIRESSNHCKRVVEYVEGLHQRLSDFFIFSCMSTDLLPFMDRIVFVVCALINIQTCSNLREIIINIFSNYFS